MSNILIFQPYLSNRLTSSGTLERQFRFLKYQTQHKVYALLDISEIECAEQLRDSGWVEPIVMEDLHTNTKACVKALQKEFNFETICIARTYFTPCTQENINRLSHFNWEPVDDMRYWRNSIPMLFAEKGAKVNHMVYDPLELNYLDLLPSTKYKMYSSMNNVPNAEPHCFADFGYYDKGKETPLMKKDCLFTFGGTSMSEERSKELIRIHNMACMNSKCNTFIRTEQFNNLVPNEKYEELVSKSLFTYTIPSQSPQYMSFTRMLLALSQNTIPLIHPDNNLDCLFGEDFKIRESLRQFFKMLVVPISDLSSMLKSDYIAKSAYRQFMSMWHSTEYYKWLQEAL